MNHGYGRQTRPHLQQLGGKDASSALEDTGGARSTKGLQQPVTCGAELLQSSTTRVGSRASCREHPHVPTPLSSGWTEAESPQRPKPTFSHLPGLIHSQHPQPRVRSDENGAGPIRARVTSVHQPIKRRLIASVPPPAAWPLTGRRGSRGAERARGAERPEASASGKPRRALSAAVEAASGGCHSPHRVPGPRGPCWGRSQAGRAAARPAPAR